MFNDVSKWYRGIAFKTDFSTQDKSYWSILHDTSYHSDVGFPEIVYLEEAQAFTVVT